MAAKIQKVTIKAEAKGFKKAAGDVKTLGDSQSKTIRAQQNLGKASAASGRQFAAQSQGLGGLVSAYAGAAATVFALQQAFSALSAAAQFDQIIQGTRTLAAQVGANGDEVLKKVREISKGQLTLVETSKAANIALSAGFNQSQLEALTEVSLKASRALGRNFTDALTRLTRGTAKLEPELLDELGIFTRIEPAVEKYAASLSKSASSLTSFERRQAFVNEAIDEGQRKFGAINTVTPTTAEKFEQLSASFIDLGYKVGSFITDRLVPLADFFTNNLLAKITLFAVVGVKVFGVAIRELGSFGSKAFAGLGLYIDSTINKLTSLTANTEKTKRAMRSLSKGLGPDTFELSRVSKEGRADITPLVKAARDGNLDAAGARRLKSQLQEEKKRIAETTAELRKRKVAAEAAGRSTDTLTKQIQRKTVAANQLNRAIKRTNAALVSQGVIARSTARALLATEAAFKVLATGAAFLIRTINTILLLGTALAGAVALFAQLTGSTEKLNRLFAIAGKAIGAAFDESLTKQQSEGIKAITNSILETSEATKALREFSSKEIKFKISYGFLGIGKLGDIEGESIVNESALKNNIGDAVERAVKAGGSRQSIRDAFRTEYTKLFGDRLIKELKPAELALAEGMFNLIKDATTAAGEKGAIQIGDLAERLGVAASQITRIFDTTLEGKDFTLSVQKALDTSFAGDKLGKIKIDLEAPGSKKLQEIYFRLVEFSQALALGTTNREDAAKKVASTENLIRRLIKESGKELKINEEVILSIFKTELNSQKLRADGISAIANQRKEITKLFGSEIKRAENLNGYLDDSLNIAQTEAQVKSNRINQLGDIVSRTKELVQLERQGILTGQENLDLAGLGRDAQKALIGGFIKTREEAKKLNTELEKQVVSLKKAADIGQIELDIQTAQRALQLQSARNDLIKQQRQEEERRLQAAEKLRSTLLQVNRNSKDFLNDLQSSFENGPLGALMSTRQSQKLQIEINSKAFERAIEDEKRSLQLFIQQSKTNILSIQQELKSRKTQLLIEQKILENEGKLADIKARATITERDLQKRAFEDRIKLLMQDAKNYGNHISGIAEVLAQDRFERALALRPNAATDVQGFGRGLNVTVDEAASISDLRSLYVSSMSENIEANNKLGNSLGKVRGISEQYTTALDAANKVTRNQAKAIGNKTQAELLDLKAKKDIQALENRLSQERDNIKQRIADSALTTQEAAMKYELFVQSIEQSNSKLGAVAVSFVESFQGNLQTSLESLFTAVGEGTLTLKGFRDGFNQFLGNILTDIQSSLIQEGLVSPITDYLKESITKLPGLSGFGDDAEAKLRERQNTVLTKLSTEIAELNGILSGGISTASGTNTGRSADASARLTGGASSTVTDPIALRQGGTIVGSDKGLNVNAEKKKTADLLQGTQEQTTGFLDNISGATIATFATVAAATGDFKTAMIATFAQMFLEIAIQKAVASFGAGAAHGGSVPFGNKVQSLAGGGSVVARRDRVPALLEPGEFVIRKPAAKAIGGSALNQLNATGKMDSGNNVVVNVQNNGTPQQVETTQVRTDTGQMIIDLVVKDIKNNGRVRKAMRG